MSPRKRSKRKVSNGAEPSTRQRKRHQPDPQDASSEEDSADEKELVRLDTDNVYLRMLADVVYWDVVVSHNLGKNTLAGCFHRLTAHLENQLDVDPTVEDYQNLNNMLLDTLFFCDDVSKLPSPIDHSDLVAALDATHPLIGALRTAKFTLAGDRPRLLQSILSEAAFGVCTSTLAACRVVDLGLGFMPGLLLLSLRQQQRMHNNNDSTMDTGRWTPDAGITTTQDTANADEEIDDASATTRRQQRQRQDDAAMVAVVGWRAEAGTVLAEFAILDSFVGSDEEYFSQQICGLLEHAVTLLRQNKEDISTPLNLKCIDVQVRVLLQAANIN
ncbi:hypothetical protein BDZ89DRAFT_1137526 [Hymenopellis radicata]|nr:hypothetical protein BDZ89DRAFT_1137526 [Hymenopellis radicata]